MAEVHPRRFGKYVLLKPLARGGMGEIHVAATGEPGFQKFCVIKKVISADVDRGKSNRFLDEAKVVLRLGHANLVPTFDAGEADGEFYIAMELVEGQDLREIWNACVRTRTRIPLDVALHVGREVARALAYVHSYGDLHLVHRDVAPPNILLSYFGEVKLTDFGLARSVLKQEHTAPGVIYGRATYLAPEQARGEIADARTDIYALGIVLWELLTGNQYLQLASLDAATAMSVVRHPRQMPPSAKAPWVAPELDAVVMRALAPAREERFQTAEELRRALADVIARVSPRADAERAAEFLRGLYGDAPRTDREERERLLAESAALLGPPASEPEEAATRIWRRSPEPAPAAPPAAAPAAASDFTGRVVEGRYRALRKIGEGGMGAVYAGEHVEIGKPVAIKILHPAYSKQRELVERFRREARAASRIGHPNIIDVTDFGTTEDGCAYFVMELLDGIDLADVLSHERRLDPARSCEITIQICRALEAAHAAGVIHRDLKPENIFLVARDGKADFVKVLDFGIARSLSRRDSRRLTNPGVAMGTPEYMAPDQAMGGSPDRRSDVYSVGALLYEMVTGAPPHAASPEGMAGRLTGPPPSPRVARPEISEELARIILRALEPDPEQRYQTMRDLQYDLTKSLLGRPRAVAELLGLRELDVRPEESGAARDREPQAPPAGVVALAAPAVPEGPPPAPAVVALVPTTERRPARAPARQRALVQFGATFALLTAAAAAVVGVYRLLPAPAGQATAAAPPRPPEAPGAPDAAAHAARARELTAELERLVSGPPPLGFGQLPLLELRLASLRREGGGAAADRLAARAAGALEQAAVAELDAGAIDAGISHYKLALAVDPAGGGQREIVETLRARGEAALARRRPGEAVRWAREALSLAEADPDAHALLGAALLGSREYAGAAAEYGKALTSRPQDAGFRRGLARARRGLVRPAAAPAAPGSGRAPATAPESEGASAQPPERPSAPAPESDSAPPPSGAGEAAGEEKQ
jgi:serine/threonine protein kinase